MEDLIAIRSEDGLKKYLAKHTQFRFKEFLNAGRRDGLSFDKIYKNLRKLRGERGLSNSEAGLASALWAASQKDCDIDYLSLSDHFPMSGKIRNAEILREKLIASDAIILSSPVYFGDRSSLAQSLIEFIAGDKALSNECKGKIFAGLSVGAKRNGGQETTLIYLLLDMVNLNFLIVGNSSNTTSQYGGTAVAGDVGKLHDDDYGISTSIGTGERVARVARLGQKRNSENIKLVSKLRLQLWLLADGDKNSGEKFFEAWAEDMRLLRPNVEIEVINFTKHEIIRCIACDICPTHLGPAKEYRCIISSSGDGFVLEHERMMEADAVLLCAFSPEDRSDFNSVYQQFIERTRYIRRDNYLFSDILFAPFIVSELEARQNLHLRMLTSALRHHTILHHPILAMFENNQPINEKSVKDESLNFIDSALRLTVARLSNTPDENLIYNPLGYEISQEKMENDKSTGELLKFKRQNNEHIKLSAKRRLSSENGEGE